MDKQTRTRWGFALAAGVLLGAAAWAPGGAGEQDGTLAGRLAWQIALDRAGFSPGILDGNLGRKTTLATMEYQQTRGLSPTGGLDAATAAALGVAPDKALTTYTIQGGDPGQIGPTPRKWSEKARLNHLLYGSLQELVAEKFHCTRGLLAQLNPGKNLAGLKVGDTLVVPNVTEFEPPGRGDRIEISFSEKVIRVRSSDGRLVALLHCSIAADKSNLPSGPASVAVITHNPTYSFDPAKWPEVKDVHEKVLIPPGPRNPVGLCWMGLSLKGYGIHGSPSPEMIGKTGSHGCIRLTNWDAVRLSKMIRVGTPVAFLRGAASANPALAQAR